MHRQKRHPLKPEVFSAISTVHGEGTRKHQIIKYPESPVVFVVDSMAAVAMVTV